MLDHIKSTRLTVKTPDGPKKFYLKTLYGVFDMIAKAPILNMHQFNGTNGCPSCLQPGVRISRTQTYPPGRNCPLRTTQSMKEAGVMAERENSIIDGIKGFSVLSCIVPDLANGAPIDMHCVLEGVTKRLLDKWITSPRAPYYINKHKLEMIDNSLTNQRPPHDFSRAPRSIQKHRKFFKASEYRC